MTGEVTLRGRVLPIGGLKEKLLAALRAGIKTVLIPQENEKDLADIPDNVKRKLEIVPVSDCDEVLARALVKELTPIEWTESEDDVQTTRTPQGDGEQPGVLTHYAGARNPRCVLKMQGHIVGKNVVEGKKVAER